MTRGPRRPDCRIATGPPHRGHGWPNPACSRVFWPCSPVTSATNWTYHVVFGEITRGDVKKMTDLNLREVLTFLPVVIGVLWIGIYPKPFFDSIKMSVAKLEMQVRVEETAP